MDGAVRLAGAGAGGARTVVDVGFDIGAGVGVAGTGVGVTGVGSAGGTVGIEPCVVAETMADGELVLPSASVAVAWKKYVAPALSPEATRLVPEVPVLMGKKG